MAVFREGKGQMEAAGKSFMVEDPKDLRGALDSNFGGPALVNVKIDRSSAREGKSSAGTVDRLTSPATGPRHHRRGSGPLTAHRVAQSDHSE